MTYQDAATYHARHPTHVNRQVVLTICQSGLLAEQRAPGSTPVRESVWRQRVLSWSAQRRCRSRLGQQELAGLGNHMSKYILEAITAELTIARGRHGPLHSPHEVIAVIREEYLEAEREVFAKQLDRVALRKELIQLAAVCVRTIEDLGLARADDGHCARCGDSMLLEGDDLADPASALCAECAEQGDADALSGKEVE